MRTLMVWLCMAAALGVTPTVALRAAQTGHASSLDGVWALNGDASDRLGPDEQEAADGRPAPGRGPGRGAGRGGGTGRSGGRGGFGGGGSRGAGRAGGDRDQMGRRLEALRDILRPAARLTITRTDTMVIVVTEQGGTTRLVPDNSRVKDESTGVERRTRWQETRLTSELTGLGPGRIVETYGIDATTGQLVLTLQLPPRRNSDDKTGRTVRRVYDPVRP